ncbi:MAG: hypothetical protein AVDCRST_MAG59-3181, partial [uncultured Thermomicrobiales bacterium]
EGTRRPATPLATGARRRRLPHPAGRVRRGRPPAERRGGARPARPVRRRPRV